MPVFWITGNTVPSSRASHRSRRNQPPLSPLRTPPSAPSAPPSRAHLISTLWSVLGAGTDTRHMEAVASMVNALVDFFDEGEQSEAVLSAWQGFEIEQRRQFPELVPAAVGAGYARITSGHVLISKHATAGRGGRGVAQVWDYVVQAVLSSSAPPPPARFLAPPPWVHAAARAAPGYAPSPSFVPLSSTPTHARCVDTPPKALVRKWDVDDPGVRVSGQ
ncbi:hypothetical protein DFH08DRAFT_969180 [Mycena albidolilacea]|uniref:Uncharacterized protein n=1 Tax=Mycena albidolilacea TaxID=1033008 RepID=A0AAD6ZJ94_9AGAR|nr:hypothetical protein DFH08DRAFT_969180 [Mycena albidolilacea]